MTTEEQSETEKVLLKNKAVQLQVVYNNEFYKHFSPPELPFAFGTMFIASLVGKFYITVMEEIGGEIGPNEIGPYQIGPSNRTYKIGPYKIGPL